jgi:dolichol kinase
MPKNTSPIAEYERTHSKILFKPRNDLHLLRKIWHVATGLAGLAFYSLGKFDQEEMAIILFIFSGLAFTVELLRLKIDSVNNGVMKVMGPFMRESERGGLTGFPFYALGVSLSMFFFSEEIAILSILFLIFSDPISSFFGILYGRDKILPNKSLQGTLAGFVACYFVCMLYLIQYEATGVSAIIFALIAGVIGCISELLSGFVDDNLTIPLISGLGLTALNIIIPLL